MKNKDADQIAIKLRDHHEHSVRLSQYFEKFENELMLQSITQMMKDLQEIQEILLNDRKNDYISHN